MCGPVCWHCSLFLIKELERICVFEPECVLLFELRSVLCDCVEDFFFPFNNSQFISVLFLYNLYQNYKGKSSVCKWKKSLTSQ